MNLVIPSYVNSSGSSVSSSEGRSSANVSPSEAHSSIEKYLKDVLINTVMAADKNKVRVIN